MNPPTFLLVAISFFWPLPIPVAPDQGMGTLYVGYDQEHLRDSRPKGP